MTAVEWVDELPGRPYDASNRGMRPNMPQERSKDLYEHAAELVKNPMRWAKYPRPIATAYSAQRTADAIREGTIAAYDPKAGFQAVSRGGVCYLRYNPDAIDPHLTAYWEGYAAGRMDAMGEVGAAIWELRNALAGIEGWDKHRSTSKRRGQPLPDKPYEGLGL